MEQEAASIAEHLGLASNHSKELVRIERVVVVAHADLQKLLDKKNPMTTERVVLSGVHAHAWIEPDGSVSLEKLWPPPKLGESSCPRLELRQSKLTLQGAAGSRPLEFNLDEALVLKHVDAMPAVSSNATGTDATLRAIQASHIVPRPFPRGGTSAFAEHFAFQVDSDGQTFDVHAEVRKGKFSSELVSRLPVQYREKLQPLAGLELVLGHQGGGEDRAGKTDQLCHSQSHP